MLITTTGASLWLDLIREGQDRSHIHLSETVQAYTVHLLQRYLASPELINTNLALGYLESQAQNGAMKYGSLWRTADSGLLLSGLFPGQARARNVSVAYFTGMSQACFSDLANLCDSFRRPGKAQEFREISLAVEAVACVLHCTRPNTTTVHEILNLNPKERI